MAKVELKKLFKTYNKKIKALEDINLTIEDGQFFVLLGPSGAGKTTTLRCIAGLEKIDSGDVFFDDGKPDKVWAVPHGAHKAEHHDGAHPAGETH